MSHPRTAFRHSALESNVHIRLLKVSPDLCDGLISMSLTHVLLETESYNCLSYVWGETASDHEVLINGNVFRVRRNLHDFLERSRTLCPHEYLWVDAIAINQSDVRERNAQVERMGEIYKDAGKVFMWLGVSAGVDSVVSLVRDMATVYKSVMTLRAAALDQWSDHLEPAPGPLAPWSNCFWAACRLRLSQLYVQVDPDRHTLAARLICILIKEHVVASPDRFKESFTAIVSCEYISRVWVCQEVAYARNPWLVTSGSSLSFLDFMYVFGFGVDDTKDSLAAHNSVVDAAGRLLAGCEMGSLFSLRRSLEDKTKHNEKLQSLVSFYAYRDRKLGCKIPRDRIYAIRGLIDLGTRLSVDYQTDEVALFWKAADNFTKSYGDSDGSYEILSLLHYLLEIDVCRLGAQAGVYLFNFGGNDPDTRASLFRGNAWSIFVSCRLWSDKHRQLKFVLNEQQQQYELDSATTGVGAMSTAPVLIWLDRYEWDIRPVKPTDRLLIRALAASSQSANPTENSLNLLDDERSGRLLAAKLPRKLVAEMIQEPKGWHIPPVARHASGNTADTSWKNFDDAVDAECNNIVGTQPNADERELLDGLRSIEWNYWDE
ncbi:uncharacterized protein AB675_1035 [Cyphellophora attinorum]|uniref:Heterokaryon incompatibility domain-containing protein n=1 Tax=Cyphellophora attinorum TaxID=1664694 RepID=A0A0N1H875_9EURO|nr:uncharacterized protein AB675_1035 [Phialophora attinorum]KPI38046.1 hypothetical protein AB675_1035 [Phialophora attinorum]